MAQHSNNESGSGSSNVSFNFNLTDKLGLGVVDSLRKAHETHLTSFNRAADRGLEVFKYFGEKAYGIFQEGLADQRESRKMRHERSTLEREGTRIIEAIEEATKPLERSLSGVNAGLHNVSGQIASLCDHAYQRGMSEGPACASHSVSQPVDSDDYAASEKNPNLS